MSIRIGVTNEGKEIRISQKNRGKGVVVIGPVASGKFSLSVLPMINQDINNRGSVVYLGESEEMCNEVIKVVKSIGQDYKYIDLNGKDKDIIANQFADIDIVKDLKCNKSIIVNTNKEELGADIINTMICSLIVYIVSAVEGCNLNLYIDGCVKYISSYVLKGLIKNNLVQGKSKIGIHIIEDSYIDNIEDEFVREFLLECSNIILHPGCEKEDVKIFDFITMLFPKNEKEKLGNIRFGEFKTATVLSILGEELELNKVNLDFI